MISRIGILVRCGYGSETRMGASTLCHSVVKKSQGVVGIKYKISKKHHYIDYINYNF
jgi:hypothetical protein